MKYGRVRTSNLYVAKINCHRNYGKVFAFTHSKKKVLKKLCYRIFVNVSLVVLQAMQKSEGVCRIPDL